MKKVIFIDVDGTLRNDNQEITEQTKKSLDRIKTIGFEPVLCTGRPRDYAEKLKEEISASRYIILNNGAEIYDCEQNEVLYQKPMNSKSILDLYNIANKDNVRFILATNGTRYVNKVKHKDLEILIDEPMQQFLNNNKVIQVTIASPDFDTIKNMYEEIMEIENIKIMNKHKSLVDVSFEKVGTIYYDIVDSQTSKGEAVKEFCRLLNISRQDCIAIGDDNNDIPMFNEVGYKVAMDNALPNVKKIANFITQSNNNDGVSVFLEKLYKENS